MIRGKLKNCSIKAEAEPICERYMRDVSNDISFEDIVEHLATVLKLVLLNVSLDQLTTWIGIVCLCHCLIMIECSMMTYGGRYIWEKIFFT